MAPIRSESEASRTLSPSSSSYYNKHEQIIMSTGQQKRDITMITDKIKNIPTAEDDLHQ